MNFLNMKSVLAKVRRVTGHWRLKLANRFSRRSVTGSGAAVVSLTTHGTRLALVYLTIESIAAGAVRPTRMVLWLNPAVGKTVLPKTLLNLQRRGLEIQFSDNFGPHTKYFPYVASESRHQLPMVTADDDVLYPLYWLQDLVLAHQSEPQHVHCYRARRVQLRDGALRSYSEWPFSESTVPSILNFATGVSGVIYPPALMDALRDSGLAFMGFCPKADDIWLHAMALRHGYRVKQMHATYRDFPVAPMTQGIALFIDNARPEGNDQQIVATYTRADILALTQSS